MTTERSNGDPDAATEQAWEKFSAGVRAALSAAAPAPGPMPILCEHVARRWQGSDGAAWVHCNKCGSSQGSLHGAPELGPIIIGWTMPAAPNGTTMDVTDGGKL